MVSPVARVRCFGVELPMMLPHTMSHGRDVAVVTSTIVEVTDQDGTSGYGESVPLHGSYIDGFAESQRAAVALLARSLDGIDVHDSMAAVRRMDEVLIGHPTAKACLDAALWDLRGKRLGRSVASLLGGRQVESFPSFQFISFSTPTAEIEQRVQESIEAGFRRWQFKVGDGLREDVQRVRRFVEAVGDADDFVSVDANRAMTLAEATQFVARVEDTGVFVEQLCETLEELAMVRERTALPVIADESVRSVSDLVRCFATHSADAVNLKLARLGGITRTAQLADLAVELGYQLLIDEPLGGQLADAAMAHLAVRVPERNFLAATHLTDSRIRAEDQPWLSGAFIASDRARVSVPERPGLGVDVDPAGLGDALFEVRV